MFRILIVDDTKSVQAFIYSRNRQRRPLPQYDAQFFCFSCTLHLG